MLDVRSDSSAEWQGPGVRSRKKKKFRWSLLLWSLIWPRGGDRIVPTPPGIVLIGLSFGLGTAAYNSSSNILFITLSLLLACLILSGVLSWLNLRRVAWRMGRVAPWRMGKLAQLTVELRNGKRFLPTYGLWFDFVARAVASGGPAKVESTITGKGIDVRAVLRKAEEAEARGSVPLEGRLDAAAETRLEWSFTPSRRGKVNVELAGVGSLFPFGFLKKYVGTDLGIEAIVWPAPVEYRRLAAGVSRRVGGAEQVARLGSGGDLLSLRRYAPGDSHRLIHWKASARTQQLLVRQFGTESSEGLTLWLRTRAEEWPRPEQFELLVSFTATLAEDLFRAGKLRTVAINDEAPAAVRHLRDVEAFLDRLAVVAVMTAGHSRPLETGKSVSGKNLLTFAPEGLHGVSAYLDGNKAAAA